MAKEFDSDSGTYYESGQKKKAPTVYDSSSSDGYDPFAGHETFGMGK